MLLEQSDPDRPVSAMSRGRVLRAAEPAPPAVLGGEPGLLAGPHAAPLCRALVVVAGEVEEPVDDEPRHLLAEWKAALHRLGAGPAHGDDDLSEGRRRTVEGGKGAGTGRRAW
jgi:hypothetical protein